MSESGNAGDRPRDRMAERLAALGLERDPFPESDLHMDFFSRGGRERQLETLADLPELACPLVLITGPAGVGRSTCFHALMRRLPDDVRSARVTAGVFLSARNLLQAVARAMGLAVDAEESLEEVRDRLYQQIADLGAAHTLCATLVDDADELEADALDELVSLAELSAETPNVRVLLFGGEGMRRVLADAVGADRVEPLVHELRLEPYSLNELRGYLQFRLARAGLSGPSPFTEQDYQDIYLASRGLPGEANAEARRLLLARRKRLTPAQLKIVGAGIAVVVVIGVLMVLLMPQSTGPDLATVQERALRLPPSVDLTLPSTALDVGEAAGDAAAAAEVRDGGWVPLGPRGEDRAGGGASTSAGSEPPATLPAESTTGAARALEPFDLSISDAVEDRAQPVSESETEPEASASAATPAAVVATDASEASVRPASEGHALLDRDASRYVLQVLVLSARDRAEAWVRALPDPSAYEIYSRRRDGRNQYVVLQGDYRDRAAANAAVDSVERVTGQRPFVRTLASVHEELD